MLILTENYFPVLNGSLFQDVIRFWISAQGVDGFRMDAVPFLFEDPEFRDEPESGKPDIPDEDDYGFLDHIYTFNLPQVYDMIHQFNDVISEFESSDGFDRCEKINLKNLKLHHKVKTVPQKKNTRF